MDKDYTTRIVGNKKLIKAMGETKKEILTRLKNIEAKLDTILSQIKMVQAEKEPESLERIHMAVQITGLAIPTIYGYASRRQIPHYKKGKKLYFKRSELEKWIESGKRSTEGEIREKAKNFDRFR
jgi:predicted DNA-binding transcriptional regulator AlpA